MIAQFKILYRVKELREEQCARAVEAKREQVANAARAVETARQKVEESKASFAEREERIYEAIIKEVVGLPKIDTVKHKVKRLEKEHQSLVDAMERAIHVHNKLIKELEEVRKKHQESIIARDKYQITMEHLETDARVQRDAAEELELEDITVKPLTGVG